MGTSKMCAPADKRFRYLPVAASLGLLAVIMALRIHFLSVIINHNRRLTAEIEMLRMQTGYPLAQSKENVLNVNHAQLSVDAYCPRGDNISGRGRECRTCLTNWRHFQSSCYFIYNTDGHNQKNWTEARNHCRRQNADLVVIGSLKEQEFISNHSGSSWGDSGFWMGLRAELGQWTWVSGTQPITYNWIQKPSADAFCAISIGGPALVGWNAVDCNKPNRWICEMKALSI